MTNPTIDPLKQAISATNRDVAETHRTVSSLCRSVGKTMSSDDHHLLGQDLLNWARYCRKSADVTRKLGERLLASSQRYEANFTRAYEASQAHDAPRPTASARNRTRLRTLDLSALDDVELYDLAHRLQAEFNDRTVVATPATTTTKEQK